MTTEELQQVGYTWKQVHLRTVISKRNIVESLNISKYDLKGVKGRICMMRDVVIPPFVTVMVKGVAKLTTHSKYMNVVIEPIVGYLDHIAMARSYEILRPGIGKINVCLRNHSAKQITLPKQTVVGEIAVANAIPSLLTLKPTEDDSLRDKASTQQGQSESQKEPLKKIDLTGLWDWSLDDQKVAWELIVEYASIFAMRKVDLDKKLLVKRSIRLMDNTPFKEQYQCIPLSMCEEV